MRRRFFFFAAAASGAALVMSTQGCSGDDTTSVTPTADSGPVVVQDGGAVTDATISIFDASNLDATTPSSQLSGPVDRAGRAYIQKMLVSPQNGDSYNAFSSFEQISAIVGDPTVSGADFQSHLVLLDNVDGKSDWNGGAADAGADDAGTFPHPLVTPLLTDGLIVDPTKPFSATGYLDVELSPATHATCGGRWVGDDALDVTLSYLISKKSSGISDGVSAATKPPTLTFPYLAAPN